MHPLTVDFKNDSFGNIKFILCVVWFEEEERRAAYQWSEHDDEILRVVKCRWRKCGAVLQSRAHCLKHVQVAHVGELVVGSFLVLQSDW